MRGAYWEQSEVEGLLAQLDLASHLSSLPPAYILLSVQTCCSYTLFHHLSAAIMRSLTPEQVKMVEGKQEIPATQALWECYAALSKHFVYTPDFK